MTGALSVAPRSIELARDALILLLLVSGAFTAHYLGLSQMLSFGLGFVFLAGFVFWRYHACHRVSAGVSSLESFQVTEAGIAWVGCASPIVLQGVIRHWAGITLLCLIHKNHRLVPRRMTLWQEHFEPEQYRRLNVLLNWLVRGRA